MDFNTYVINLDSQKRRFETQSKYLTNVGITPIRNRAFLYDEISNEEFNRHFLPKAKLFTSQSSIACCYSHMKVLEQFVMNDPNPVALILEDDAYPLFNDVFEIVDKLEKIDWDILCLHCDGFFCPSGRSIASLYSSSAAAYFVTKEGAKKLLEHKFSNHVDIETNSIQNLKKVIDEQNSFWTDENATLTGEVSTNRKGSICPNLLNYIKPGRGEKNFCHIIQSKVFRIPIINIDVNVQNIIVIFIFIAILLYTLHSR
jgi:GR25 family glycosyltransferase involved in LPS biosynthesis